MNASRQSADLERKLAGIDSTYEELRSLQKHIRDRRDDLAIEGLTAVVLDRYPRAQFIETDMYDEYTRALTVHAILDERGWPLWFKAMIGPRSEAEAAFESRVGKYAFDIESGGADVLALAAPIHSLYADQYNGFWGRLLGRDDVHGILILS